MIVYFIKVVEADGTFKSLIFIPDKVIFPVALEEANGKIKPVNTYRTPEDGLFKTMNAQSKEVLRFIGEVPLNKKIKKNWLNLRGDKIEVIKIEVIKKEMSEDNIEALKI